MAALPQLPRRRARSPEGERAAVEVAMVSAPILGPSRVPHAGRNGDRRRPGSSPRAGERRRVASDLHATSGGGRKR